MASAAPPTEGWDVVIVGAGAAGLATAIFTARRSPGLRILLMDGAKTVGAKILVSGGSRCNVTNRSVSERDFWGGSPTFVRHVLRAFPAERAAAFFEELGVALHEEEDGKLFPDSNRSRTVLEALLGEVHRCGVTLRTGARVTALARDTGGFVVGVRDGKALTARSVVLATGGRSLPKTGSDGSGYQLATALGHTLVAPTPALAPLVLEGTRHQALAGRSHPASLSLRAHGRVVVSLTGSLLWTHFGVSGPVALNLSRHWHRAQWPSDVSGTSAGTADVGVSLNLAPGETHQSLDRWFLDQTRDRPLARVATVVAQRLPAAVAEQWLGDLGIEPHQAMAHLPRESRRALVGRLIDIPLQVRDSRGYAYAEVTAGGIEVHEVDHRTMGSRVVPGLYLAGEILDVDGRLGGFNFQWAWSTAWVAGQALARTHDRDTEASFAGTRHAQ
jgi:hypothetical protein